MQTLFTGTITKVVSLIATRTAINASFNVLSLATKSSYKDKKTGEYNGHTEWHCCIVWGRLSESTLCLDFQQLADARLDASRLHGGEQRQTLSCRRAALFRLARGTICLGQGQQPGRHSAVS